DITSRQQASQAMSERTNLHTENANGNEKRRWVLSSIVALVVGLLGLDPAVALAPPGYTKILINHVFVQPKACAAPEPTGLNMLGFTNKRTSDAVIRPTAATPSDIVGDDGSILADYDSFTLASASQSALDRVQARAAAAGVGMSLHD